jgi:hypothetical protein
MTDWWEAPYKGGPMAVPAAHFPLGLYPPDAAPSHIPSKPGPDVLAYKRTICRRLGRWEPWDHVVVGRGPQQQVQPRQGHRQRRGLRGRRLPAP